MVNSTNRNEPNKRKELQMTQEKDLNKLYSTALADERKEKMTRIGEASFQAGGIGKASKEIQEEARDIGRNLVKEARELGIPQQQLAELTGLLEKGDLVGACEKSRKLNVLYIPKKNEGGGVITQYLNRTGKQASDLTGEQQIAYSFEQKEEKENLVAEWKDKVLGRQNQDWRKLSPELQIQYARKNFETDEAKEEWLKPRVLLADKQRVEEETEDADVETVDEGMSAFEKIGRGLREQFRGE